MRNLMRASTRRRDRLRQGRPAALVSASRENCIRFEERMLLVRGDEGGHKRSALGRVYSRALCARVSEFNFPYAEAVSHPVFREEVAGVGQAGLRRGRRRRP